MKRLSVVILSFFLLATGCISDQENADVILQREIQAFEKYIADNNVTGVKEERDPGLGFIFIWKETSESGVKPVPGQRVTVDYVGKFLENVVFDTSKEAVAKANNIFNANRIYEPLTYTFNAGSVIPGFDFAVSKMDIGDKILAFIPSLYAYGRAGSPPVIGGNTPLIFELELLPTILEEEDESDD
ncbi:FKBP-type peptidyl-prolyl cis-trans isomerase [Belliella pelovolcani]|uniref:Peptidyl-prolyl cis-trans isomerase n=1 Tax=Belliella pelovolcani TaxID=529505 RepID=A0A1N7JN36_9BACT|nr:FKBP-type peptidyl-prolyl cis-trans isomerase [Belliella pelovolcani]SIS50725.1 FKBP-type peptidyl-prolyl cis-trans isomerase FklB [Belliella pelovolcani]